MRLLFTIAALLTASTLPATAQAPGDLLPAATRDATPSARPGGKSAPVGAAAALTATDVDTWLDGYMPFALARGGIAGAQVVVVKDGRVLTQRGFGVSNVRTRKPVDPATTLFRPGSVSKLFTWTAVMQQVQAGRLDLDRDVNAYLDFVIPPAYGKPVTLRHLMTHTAGFAETAKHLLIYDRAGLLPLDATLKRHIPPRIYAPGTIPAYSNYGASLAGYIVQRVSGEPFADYVARHIFVPLGMTRSSFDQPLPRALASHMSTGYGGSLDKPGRFEIIGMAPAGGLSATGADMARFMIAHLANGGPLLDLATARTMRAVANVPVPGLPGMALGFYHEGRNGQTIIGHAGDTDQFHSDLHLYLDRGVGIYMSFNSNGKDGAAQVVRAHLFADFTDRYFPAPTPRLATLPTARTHGQSLVGHYVSSRAPAWSFLRLVNMLGESQVILHADDTITVSSVTDAAGHPTRWREVGPWQWVEVGGKDRLAARVVDGQVRFFSTAGLAPIIEFLPAPASMDAGWIMPTLLVTLAIVLLTALSWPILALVRRRYRYDAGMHGRALQLHRASRASAWIMLSVAAGWFILIQTLSADLSMLDGQLDPWMRLLQVLAILGIVGAVATAWTVQTAFARPGWFPRIWAVGIALAMLFLAWFVINAGLLTFALAY